VSVLAGCGMSGCHAKAGANPDDLLQSISNDFLHGNLEVARARADAARRSFSDAGTGKSPAWEMQFRLLEADILLRQNHAQDVIALLTGRDITIATQADLAIKRDWLCGLAYLRLGQAAQADSELREARRLADSTHSAQI
jgi:hypothetical protein